MARGEIGEPRVIGSAGSAFDDCAGFRRTGDGEKDGDVASDVQDPHRQRDRLAAGDARESEPVPALEDVSERCFGTRAETHPACKALRDLAVHGERLAGDGNAVGDDVLDQRRAFPFGQTTSDMRPEEPDDLLQVARIDQRERRSRHDVVAVELCRLVPVRGASRRVQERDVVGVRQLLRRGGGELAEADREHRGAQSMLERLTGSEIGRQREGADDLGSADRLLDRARHRRGRRSCEAMRDSTRVVEVTRARIGAPPAPSARAGS